MTITIHADPVPLRMDAHGDLRVGDSRVLLDLVVHAFEDGATPETIVQRYPTLHLDDVYAVIAYYLRHKEEVREYLLQREQRAAEVLRQIQARQGDMRGIRERFLSRKSEGTR